MARLLRCSMCEDMDSIPQNCDKARNSAFFFFLHYTLVVLVKVVKGGSLS